jgi:hypothetical protein
MVYEWFIGLLCGRHDAVKSGRERTSPAWAPVSVCDCVRARGNETKRAPCHCNTYRAVALSPVHVDPWEPSPRLTSIGTSKVTLT